MKTKPTWLAVAVAVPAFLVPGLPLGAIISHIYRFFIYRQVGAEPDFFYLRTLFGISAPGDLIKWVAYDGAPSVIHGAAAGAIALGIANWFCRNPNITLIAAATGALYTGVFIVIGGLGLLVMGMSGFNSDFFAMVCQLIGLWIGLFMVVEAGAMAPTPAKTA